MSDVVNPDEILMTEDGHPIGQLVIAGGDSVPAKVDGNVADENREELLREAAMKLTGDPDADAAVAELYPGYGDSELRRKAMKMFVADAMEIADISKALDVPPRTISRWSYDGQWDDLVRKEVAARNTQSVLALARLRADRRLEIAKEQLEQAKAIRDKAAEAIESGDVSLKSGTEAWAAASKIEHTLTGVSEAGTVASLESTEESKKQESGKTPLVMVFQGGLPPVRKATT